MTIQAKFVHTNLIAQDWKKLATFYEQAFGCTPVLPERDLAGQWLDDATRIPNARIRGIHLRLPGYGDAGPTLEIFQYNREEEQSKTAVNRPGFGHIAFAVDHVQAAQDAVIAAGGSALGERVTINPEGLRDPQGLSRLFKSIVVESIVPDWIPPAMPWEQVEKKFKAKVPARAKKIRGKLNVPRERFRLTEDGEYVWAGKK